MKDCIAAPDRYLDKAEIVKDSRTTRAGLVELEPGRKVFIKRYNNKGLAYTLRNLFRKSRAVRAWENALFFAENELPTPKGVAVIVNREFRILKSAFLITESLEGVVPTLEFYEKLTEDKELNEDYIDKVTALIAQLHSCGIRHGDLKLSNIYVLKKDSGYEYGFWDLDVARNFGVPLAEKFRFMELWRFVSSYVEIGMRLDQVMFGGKYMERILASYEQHSGVILKKDKIINLTGKYLQKKAGN